MFNDITDNVDLEKELTDARELLREAKDAITKERAKVFVLEDLYTETVTSGKELVDIIKKYRAKHGIADFDNAEDNN